jgi:NnrU protein
MNEKPAWLKNLFRWEQKALRVNGHSMAYVDEGKADARPVVLLHGNPTWAHLNGTIVFSSLAVLAVAGARHQDGKLLQRGGEAYRHYRETTSIVPFAAIISGRQRIAWQELPLRGLIIGLAVTVALRLVHDWIFAHGGLFVIAAVVGGAGILALVSSLRGRSQSHNTPLSDTRPAVDGGRSMRST